jgi:dephospho-CoA kinase
MNRKKVKSSNIKSIGYNSNKCILEVEFNTGAVYYYKDVELGVFKEFIDSSSLGKSFAKLIKGKYKFIKGEYMVEVNNGVPNIYFCGEAGAGKTIAAKYLISKYGSIQSKFAFPVYGLAKDYFGMTNKDRPLLQTIGTDAGREVVGEDIWVNRFQEDTKIVQLVREKLGYPKAGFVSDDVRFVNENLILSKCEWIGIYLYAPLDIRTQRLIERDGDAQLDSLNHKAELEVDLFKEGLIQIDASGDRDAMFKKIDSILEEISNGKMPLK